MDYIHEVLVTICKCDARVAMYKKEILRVSADDMVLHILTRPDSWARANVLEALVVDSLGEESVAI
jgi:hypothetical protein